MTCIPLGDDDAPAELQEDSCNCDGGAHEMFCSTCEDSSSKGVGDLKPPTQLPASGFETKSKPGKTFEMNWTVDLDRVATGQ